MANSEQVNDDPRTIAQLADILASRWDVGSAVKAGYSGVSTFYGEQAVIVAGMLSAGARETEVQRYLRQLEQKVLPVTLHSAEARHAIAIAIWRVARGLDPIRLANERGTSQAGGSGLTDQTRHTGSLPARRTTTQPDSPRRMTDRPPVTLL